MSDQELLELLQQSRANNNNSGVTGMLLYVKGNFLNIVRGHLVQQFSGRFIQVLEGSPEAVEKLYASITKDSRHYDLIVLKREAVEIRSFEDWQMGFTSMQREEYEQRDGFFELDDTFLEREIPCEHRIPLNYLRSFYQMSKSKR